MSAKVIELVGGSRDGERVQLVSFVTEFQAIHRDGRRECWRETVEQTKDGVIIFRWESK